MISQGTKIQLSIAVITKNEADKLATCLRSVAFADQIVVVDSGSSDETVEIAKAHGADAFIEPWKGFGAQKQSAIDKCRNEWVLILDADETIPEETAREIKKIVSGEHGGFAGYSFPRKNWFQGRWIRHMGWWPDRVVRLFRKGSGRMSEASVHESVLINGRVAELNACIEHFTESDLSKVLKKIDHYSTLGAQEAFNAGKTATVWSACFRAKLTFFQDFVLRLGFLDGTPGLTLAITDAINKFFKYSKLSEMNRAERNRK